MKPATVIGIILGILVLGGALYYFTQGPSASPDDDMLTLTSSAFENGAAIPQQFTCDGANISPALSISGVPEGTMSLVLIMDDPDVPTVVRPEGVFDHWVLYAIPPDTREIPENSLAGDTGLNGAGKDAYTGPCPPSQFEPAEHRYYFTLYALDNTPTFAKTPTKAEVLAAIDGHVIESAELMGRFQRPAAD